MKLATCLYAPRPGNGERAFQLRARHDAWNTLSEDYFYFVSSAWHVGYATPRLRTSNDGQVEDVKD